MKALLIKELNSFFSSPIAYLVIGVYLVFNGLFLWVFPSEFNILHAGFADLNAYFFLAPWIFLFLIPALTMRSFSEEYNNGTIELLKTKPLSNWQIVLGKFLATLVLVIFSILPTLIYSYSVYQLGNPKGNIEFGTTTGSFIGLLFLASTYCAIGVFASTLSKNQIVSFIVAVCLCFFLFYGFEFIGNYQFFGEADFFIQQLGMKSHFQSISKGVLDTRDLIYFISVSLLFLALTKFKISDER
ncbi:MAG TPA: gliding motility-associated ABC transporter permease subunit GldF [Flavobacteriaceae bacterium]|nr:gliding motility-associated ABC transporter permease subunit GldF [Flavobacteriaceae bacterium]